MERTEFDSSQAVDNKVKKDRAMFTAATAVTVCHGEMCSKIFFSGFTLSGDALSSCLRYDYHPIRM